VHFGVCSVDPLTKDDTSAAFQGESARELRHEFFRPAAFPVIGMRAGSGLASTFSSPRTGAALAIFLELGDVQSGQAGSFHLSLPGHTFFYGQPVTLTGLLETDESTV
jgi:hypothetical protein